MSYTYVVVPQRISPVRLRLVVAILLILSGVGLWSLREELQLTNLSLFVAGAAVALGISTVLLSYLRGEINVGPLDSIVTPSERSAGADVEFLSGMLSRVTAALTKLQQDFAELKASSRPAAHIDTESIRAAIHDDVVSDLAERLDQRYARAARDAAHVAQVRRNFDESFLRLRNEVAALTRRGNLNLVIGTLTTAVAVGLLLYMLVPARTISTWPDLLSHYVPRLTTVIFIEVFAFFFLRLYKGSLAQIQYYQNELTTLALNWSAFELGVSLPEKASVLVEEFARANRNSKTTGDGSPPLATSDVVPVAELLKKIADVVAKGTK